MRSWSDRDNTKWFQSKMWLDLLPRLPFVLTLIGVGVGGLIHLAYCWIPLWTALALVLAPFLAHEGGYLPSGWTLWPPQMQLQRSFVPCSVVVAPVGALLLASALDDNFLFAATLFLFAACPGLSSLIHHRDKVANSSPLLLLHSWKMADLCSGCREGDRPQLKYSTPQSAQYSDCSRLHRESLA